MSLSTHFTHQCHNRFCNITKWRIKRISYHQDNLTSLNTFQEFVSTKVSIMSVTKRSMLKLTFSFSNSVSWQPNSILEHMKKKKKESSAYLRSNGRTRTRVKINSWDFDIKRETRAWAVHSMRQSTNFSMGMGSDSRWVPNRSSTHHKMTRTQLSKIDQFQLFNQESQIRELTCRTRTEELQKKKKKKWRV